MDNAELINGLRWCADESICCDDFRGEKCPYFDEKKDSCSVDEIMLAAAEALEAAEKRIAELEAQLPKEGGWISNYDGFDYDVRCSVCGEEALIKESGSHDHAYSRHCPNCGARMKGEQE